MNFLSLSAAIFFFFTLCACTHVNARATPLENQFSVDPKTHMFVDGYGRVRNFRGINIGNKAFPYYATVSEERLANYTKYGWNIVRMYVEWEGVEGTAKGVYNKTYLQELRKLGDQLGDSGLFYYVDHHQDTWGYGLCGNGAPEWATILSDQEWASFKQPLPENHTCGLKANGHVDCSKCPPTPFWWGAQYFTYADGKAFQNFYDNVQGVNDAWVDMWVETVKVFMTNNTYLFGYELLNEPWMGDIYTNPKYLIENGYSDYHNLQPLYEKAAAAIRKIDPDHLILYEPTTRDTQLLPFGDGFTQGPGGANWKNKTVYSWHAYCPISAEPGPGFPQFLCDTYYDTVSFQIHTADAQKHGGGILMSEWGAAGGDARGVHEVDYIVDLSDKYMQSWTYWDWNSVGSFELARALSRPYPQAVQGMPNPWSFDNVTVTWDFSFTLDTTIQAPTIIFTSLDMWYAGVAPKVTISPASYLSSSLDIRTGLLTLTATQQAVDGAQVFIRFSPDQ